MIFIKSKKSFCDSKGSFFLKRPIKKFKLKILFFITIGISAAILYLSKIGCIWRYFFGISCPGCGITRAWLALFKGSLKEAFDHNLMFFSVPIIFLYILYDGKIFNKKIDYTILILLALGFLINWILF